MGEITVRSEGQAIFAGPGDTGRFYDVDIAAAAGASCFHNETAGVFKEIGDVLVIDDVGVDGAARNRLARAVDDKNVVRVDQQCARFSVVGRLEGDFSDQLVDEDFVLAGKLDEAAVAAPQAAVSGNASPEREGVLSKKNHVPTIAFQGGTSRDCGTISDRDVDGILEIGILTAPASADPDLSTAKQTVRDHEGS